MEVKDYFLKRDIIFKPAPVAPIRLMHPEKRVQAARRYIKCFFLAVPGV